jgi:hypothetical protein
MSRKRKNKINLALVVAIIIFLISLVFLIIALNLDSIIILQRQEIPIAVGISDYAAINITENTNILHLGTAKKNTAAGPRNISIENSRDFPTIVEIDARGDIESLLVFERVIYLEANESREIPISTKIIQNEEFGDYSGILIITFKKLPS